MTLTNVLTRVKTCSTSKKAVSAKTYTTQKAADAVGITRATLQAWIKNGKFKAPTTKVRNGRAVRVWTESDLAKLKAVKKEIYQEKRPRR